MKVLVLPILILFVTLLGFTAASLGDCPPWSFPDRTGPLCGEFEEGFGPALYSYTLECKKCWGHGAGWLLYITLAVIPTTVLYIIVVVFHVSAHSAPLNAFIL